MVPVARSCQWVNAIKSWWVHTVCHKLPSALIWSSQNVNRNKQGVASALPLSIGFCVCVFLCSIPKPLSRNPQCSHVKCHNSYINVGSLVCSTSKSQCRFVSTFDTKWYEPSCCLLWVYWLQVIRLGEAFVWIYICTEVDIENRVKPI